MKKIILVELGFNIVLIILFLFIACSPEYKYNIDIDKSFIDLDYESIKRSLCSEGFNLKNIHYFDKKIYTNKIDIIIAINRIFAFKCIEDNYSHTAYIDLRIYTSNGDNMIIITSNPFEIKKNLKWNEKNINIIDIYKYEKWKVINTELNVYKNLSRKKIKYKYFDDNNHLKRIYKDMINPSFVYLLIQKGFFVYIDDITGRLTIYE